MNFPGSKNGMGIYQNIINQIPPHSTYIEPFLGSGAILRHKRAAACSLGVDIDPKVVEQFTKATQIPQVGIEQLLNMTGSAVACGCAIEFLSEYFENPRGGEFVYLDPPYLQESRRRQRKIYGHEFWSIADHERLLTLATDLEVPVAISGYPSTLYAKMLHGWRCSVSRVTTHAGLATECLWMNYPEPVELHDYRFLGENRGDRQRIRRKQERWKARLTRMPSLERFAVLAAINNWREER